MQAIEFSTQIMGGNMIEVPFAFRQFFTKQKNIHVVLYIEEEADEAPVNGQSILPILAKTSAFDFLKSEEEDIYSDADLIVKY